MKHTSLSWLVLLVFTTLSVHSYGALVTSSWDLIGDSTTTCSEYTNQQRICDGDTLWQNGIGYFYQGHNPKGLELNTGDNVGYGAYWHESSADASPTKPHGSNAICLLAPGHAKAEVQLTNRVGAQNSQYKFYLFVLPVGSVIPYDLYARTTEAMDSATWQMSEFSKGTVTLNADLTQYSANQYQLAVIFTNADGKGVRHRGITYRQLAVYPSTLADVTWDLCNDCKDCQEYRNQKALNKGKTLTQKDISLRYYSVTNREFDPYLGGGYWHNSGGKDNKNDNVLVLTVPSKAKGIVTLSVLPWKRATMSTYDDYTFYVFAQDADLPQPVDLFAQLSSANDSAFLNNPDSLEYQVKLNIDLSDKLKVQNLYLIFTSKTGCRCRGVAYQEAEHYRLYLDENYDNTDALEQCDKVNAISISMVRADIKGGMYNTLCLPYSVDAEKAIELFGENCEIIELGSSELDGNRLTLNFQPVETMQAGKPYLVWPQEDRCMIYANNVRIDATSPTPQVTEHVTMYGVFNPQPIFTPGETTENSVLYVASNNRLIFAHESSALRGFRDYFEITTEQAQVAAREAFIAIRQNPTDLPQTTTAAKVYKYIQDGQIIIVREGKQYNAQGALLK